MHRTLNTPHRAGHRLVSLLTGMAMIGLALLMPAHQAAATGWKENIRAGSDIVMKEHRWPVWDAGTCSWYRMVMRILPPAKDGDQETYVAAKHGKPPTTDWLRRSPWPFAFPAGLRHSRRLLFTALGSRQFLKQDSGPTDNWRNKSTTYAAPFSGTKPDAVYAAHERTQNDWHPLAAGPRIGNANKAAALHEGPSCILIDKDDSKTFFLCNRHGIFKTTDLGKSYRLVRPN